MPPRWRRLIFSALRLVPPRGPAPSAASSVALAFRDWLRALVLAWLLSRGTEAAVENGVEHGTIGFIFYQCRCERLAKPLRLDADHADRMHRIEAFGDTDGEPRLAQGIDEGEKAIPQSLAVRFASAPAPSASSRRPSRRSSRRLYADLPRASTPS